MGQLFHPALVTDISFIFIEALLRSQGLSQVNVHTSELVSHILKKAVGRPRVRPLELRLRGGVETLSDTELDSII